jgi:cohesin loading factor subunit SCC2
LTTLKNQLEKILYPFIEVGGSLSQGSALLQYIVDNSLFEYQHKLDEIFQEMSSVIPRITSLINSDLVVMSDTIIIQAVYIAIGPFFANESSTDGEGKTKKGPATDLGKRLSLRGLRFDALSLIRTVNVLLYFYLHFRLTHLLRFMQITKAKGHGLSRRSSVLF